MMKKGLSILFYLRKNRPNKNGTVSIMIRLTINSKQCPFASDLEIFVDDWDDKEKRMIGKSPEAKVLNDTLDEIKVSLKKIHKELSDLGSVTPEKIRNRFKNKDVLTNNLIEYYKQKNKSLEELVKSKIKSKVLLDKHEVNCVRLESLLKTKYKLSDIDLNDLTHDFIVDYQDYLATKYKCAPNTIAKYIQFFKGIILAAIKSKLIKEDPFAEYTIKLNKVDRGYLTEEELLLITDKKFESERLDRVRDVFLFSCFTGLAYIDVKNLRPIDIVNSFDGNLWIYKNRQKSDIQSRIPLLEIPKAIIEKYADCEEKKQGLLPIPSNQKTNEYLKEIAIICGVNKKLTFHIARHTFATTVTLAKGVSIETVSKMLGHTNITTTQVYARITDSKISNDMKGLHDQFSLIKKNYSVELDKAPVVVPKTADKTVDPGFGIVQRLLVNQSGQLDEISYSQYLKSIEARELMVLYQTEHLVVAMSKDEVVIGSVFFGEIMQGYFTLMNYPTGFLGQMHYGKIAIDNLKPLDVLNRMVS